MLTTPEEEAAARALLRDYVADVHVGENMLEPVQAGARRRRTVRRTGFAVAALAMAGCAVPFVSTGLSSPAAGSRPVSVGASVSVVTGQNLCPARAANHGNLLNAKPVGVVPGYTHTLVPGKPVAAVSCPLPGSGHAAVPLSATQLADAVSVLDAMAPAGDAIVNGPCLSPLAKNGDLYLIFDYANGARLTITASGSQLCGNRTPTDVTWSASNTAARGATGTPAQTETLEALAALR